MIGQNRQAAFQQAKADHEFQEQEQELKANTELTRAIHVLTSEIHGHVLGTSPPEASRPRAELEDPHRSPNHRPGPAPGSG
jgi:uncharacterized membrane protein